MTIKTLHSNHFNSINIRNVNQVPRLILVKYPFHKNYHLIYTQRYTTDCNASHSISPVVHLSKKTHPHINQYFIPTKRHPNQKNSNQNTTPASMLTLPTFLLDNLPARSNELLDLNTFLHIPKHQQIVIIKL